MPSDIPTREALIDLTIRRYFDAVDNRRLDDALALFQDNATFTIYPGGAVYCGRTAIGGMYEAVFRRHGHPARKIVDVCADPMSGLVSASFEARFQNDDRRTTTLYGVNIWSIEKGRFRWVKVFTGDPGFAPPPGPAHHNSTTSD